MANESTMSRLTVLICSGAHLRQLLASVSETRTSVPRPLTVSSYEPPDDVRPQIGRFFCLGQFQQPVVVAARRERVRSPPASRLHRSSIHKSPQAVGPWFGWLWSPALFRDPSAPDTRWPSPASPDCPTRAPPAPASAAPSANCSAPARKRLPLQPRRLRALQIPSTAVSALSGSVCISPFRAISFRSSSVCASGETGCPLDCLTSISSAPAS